MAILTTTPSDPAKDSHASPILTKNGHALHFDARTNEQGLPTVFAAWAVNGYSGTITHLDDTHKEKIGLGLMMLHAGKATIQTAEERMADISRQQASSPSMAKYMGTLATGQQWDTFAGMATTGEHMVRDGRGQLNEVAAYVDHGIEKGTLSKPEFASPKYQFAEYGANDHAHSGLGGRNQGPRQRST